MDIVYVTVGTTRFDTLIAKVTSNLILRILESRGCRQLVIQLGNGSRLSASRVDSIWSIYGINVKQYDFKFDAVRADIVNANFVIGHAGAGTCMDILNHGKPGLIVVNKDLMDNHQVELALQLAEEGYIFYCNVTNFGERLKSLDFATLKPYDQETAARNMNKFVACLNEMMST